MIPASKERAFSHTAGTDERILQELDDPRDLPAYTYVDAGKALGIPPATIGVWVRGQRYRRKDDTGFFEPVIEPEGGSRGPPDRGGP